jgi:RsiW-degrading membrane proteinase PrsW (M82 family)
MEDCDFLTNFDKKTKILCGACTAFSLLVTVLIAAGFGIVEPTEYGIKYNSILKKIDNTTVYTGGL